MPAGEDRMHCMMTLVRFEVDIMTRVIMKTQEPELVIGPI